MIGLGSDKNTERQKTIRNSEGFQANSNEQQNDKNTQDSEGFHSNALRGTNLNYDELLQIKLDRKGGWAGGMQCHQDLLIYWTQWSLDLDDLLI